MKITTQQAAEMLNVSASAVVSMVKAGKLTDVSGKDNGKRHAYLLELAEVNELRKTYRNPKAPRREHTALPLGGPALFVERLDRIEQKLDHLIGMWS